MECLHFVWFVLKISFYGKDPPPPSLFENNETGTQLCIEISSCLNSPLQGFACSLQCLLPVWC